MSDTAVSVEGLSKRYRMGQYEPYKGLREVLVRSASAPFQALFSAFQRSSGDPGTGRSQGKEDFWALRDVCFQVNQGEVIGIIGRNGAGKSTLLKILSRITKPTEGFAEIRGRVGSLLEVGTGFHPELTGRENVYLNGAVLGMKRSEIRRKFDEIIEFSEIDRYIDTPVKRYSSGMYMRLAFAVAAHLEPEILVVDEVLAVGDAAFQKKCLGKMGRVAQEGRTVLFVSHNMAAVSTLCSRGLVLDRGSLIYSGEIEQCITTYVAKNSQNRGSEWLRPAAHEQGSLIIQGVKSAMTGQQPDLTFELEIILESREKHKPAFMAVDVLDAAGVAVMQALPKLEGFLKDNRRQHLVKISIQLPPLIPGQYKATIWTGSHNTETLDEVKEVVMFEIYESPTRGRSYPHATAHGHIVPHSTLEYIPQ